MSSARKGMLDTVLNIIILQLIYLIIVQEVMEQQYPPI